MLNAVSVRIIYWTMVTGMSVVTDHRYAVVMTDLHYYRYTQHNFEAVCVICTAVLVN